MKKIIIIIALLMTSVSASAQISAGIKDSRYAYGTYSLNSGLRFTVEHSLYS